MLEKLSVPTRLSRNYLLKYINRDCYKSLPNKIKKVHSPHFSNVLCKFYAKGSCSRGDDCIFSHDIAQFPCSNQTASKNCTKPNCLYKHDNVPTNDYREINEQQSNSPSADERKLFISPFS